VLGVLVVWVCIAPCWYCMGRLVVSFRARVRVRACSSTPFPVANGFVCVRTCACVHVRVCVCCRACVQNLLDQIRNFRLRKRGSASVEGGVSDARGDDDKGLRKEASLSSMSGLQFGAPLCLWGLVIVV
jgi:hypothetical protein